MTPLIAQAAAAGARLIVLTEMYATGFSMHTERIAEDEGGPNEQFLVDQAREHGAWLVGSIAQHSESGKPRNVAVLAAPDGTVHRYAKIHPFSYAGEARALRRGHRVPDRGRRGLLRVSRSSATTCASPTSSGPWRPDTDLYVVVANWPAAAP